MTNAAAIRRAAEKAGISPQQMSIFTAWVVHHYIQKGHGSLMQREIKFLLFEILTSLHHQFSEGVLPMSQELARVYPERGRDAFFKFMASLKEEPIS